MHENIITLDNYTNINVHEAIASYANSTYSIVSRVAYLIGVPDWVFEYDYEPPKLDIYKELNKNKNARIIRNLCMLRTAILSNYQNIFQNVVINLRNLSLLPDLVPINSLKQLKEDGIKIEKANVLPIRYLFDINAHIVNYINNCKSLFPIWLNWNYIHNLFIMPNGSKEIDVKATIKNYSYNKKKYPYQVYINWSSSNGNILFNDAKFVTLLYKENNDNFKDLSKVSDASDLTKENVYRYLNNNNMITLAVDCENSDVYKLYATIKHLSQKSLLDKIGKIILIDDEHTTSTWDILQKFVNIPVEHQIIERVKWDKSLVDMKLASMICREHYKDGVESFILFASDSDYWALISSIPTAKFLVMVEHDKCGPDIKKKFDDEGIPFCYIDDFCTGNSNEIKTAAMLIEIREQLDQALNININTIVNNAYTLTRADMSKAEYNQFYDKYIKTAKLIIAPDGKLSIELGK